MDARRRSARSSSTTSSWRARSCASCSSSSAVSRSSAQAGNGVEALRVIEEYQPGSGVARRPDAGADRLRGRAPAACEAGIDAAGRVRDRLRPVRDRRVRGERGRLPAEAGRAGAAGDGGRAGPASGWRPDRPSPRKPDRRRRSGARCCRCWPTARAGASSWRSRSASGSCWSRPTRSSMPRSRTSQIRVVTNSLSGTSNYRTLDELQARLDPAVFWRVHRSHLVNINKIKEIVPWFSRNYILKMKDAKAPKSRSAGRRPAAAGVFEAMSDSHNHDPYAAPRRRRRPLETPVTPRPAAGRARDADARPLPSSRWRRPTRCRRRPSPAPSPREPRLALDGTSLWLNRLGEELVAWLKTLASAAVYATLIVTFGFQVARVEGQSMAPTLAGPGSADRQQARLPHRRPARSATS